MRIKMIILIRMFMGYDSHEMIMRGSRDISDGFSIVGIYSK